MRTVSIFTVHLARLTSDSTRVPRNVASTPIASDIRGVPRNVAPAMPRQSQRAISPIVR